MASDWRSADALRDRGLLMIDDDSAVAGGSEPAEPAKPRRPYSERPVARARRAKAQELIDRLVAEGRVRITAPDDDEVAEWRRVVNYAKRHGLEPAANRINGVPPAQVAEWAGTSVAMLYAAYACCIVGQTKELEARIEPAQSLSVLEAVAA
ncbi:hypothetical protein AB0L35_37835 [Streptomyces sp. NPDC052309]|uniref:hypothetical protein n=1 Tax=Streptomyces sp. NPDC052309 TaxID=3155421 RepID=UPI00343C9501